IIKARKNKESMRQVIFDIGGKRLSIRLEYKQVLFTKNTTGSELVYKYLKLSAFGIIKESANTLRRSVKKKPITVLQKKIGKLSRNWFTPRPLLQELIKCCV